MIYLATPYSHPDPEVRKARFEQACRLTAKLMNKGLVVFSPIAHSHPISELCNLPTHFEYYRNYDEDMISSSKGLYVVMMDGWKQSIGVQAEIKFATSLGIPITYIEPE